MLKEGESKENPLLLEFLAFGYPNHQCRHMKHQVFRVHRVKKWKNQLQAARHQQGHLNADAKQLMNRVSIIRDQSSRECEPRKRNAAQVITRHKYINSKPLQDNLNQW